MSVNTEQSSDFLSLFRRVSGQGHGDFESIALSIARPEDVRSWSFGEVKKSETVNYRTFKPERDGLFCGRIFGPIRDYECVCGKYRRIKHRGTVCEKCGVEVTVSRVRRERMGHIELAAPVAHVWFARSIPSRIGILLDLTPSDLNRILCFECYVVVEPGLTTLRLFELLDEESYHRALETEGDSFQVQMGAEALREMLSKLDLEEERRRLCESLDDGMASFRRRKVVKRLELIDMFLKSQTRPEWMVLDVIPVLPPELRPLVPLDGGRFVSSDLNALYRRVVNRNNRLRRLLELRAPDVIIRNEKRMLQESVDALFDNSRRERPVLGGNRRPLKSLTEMLKGKQGRFRQNLLGKRVDYSGRSVIVVGPHLKLHQCGLPKLMALELFKPFLYHRLELNGLAPTLKVAKMMVEQEQPVVWDVLKEIMHGHPVLLNRAPTLHRLGIQAFEPVLIEDKAIQLHPLVCAAYNADFDGDQMAVHVPLSLEARMEAYELMMSTNNILSPANGAPVLMPSKDIVLGLYYLTLMRKEEKGEGAVVKDSVEAQYLYENKRVSLHAKVWGYAPDEYGNNVRTETTLGRMILLGILPKGMPFALINKVMASKDVGHIIDWSCRYQSRDVVVELVDNLMEYGFRYATRSGISFGKADLIVPDSKEQYVKDAWKRVNTYHQQYMDGLITQGERFNKVTDSWSQCAENVSASMMDVISEDRKGSPLNSVYMMMTSGARGSVAQMRQLTGMRGLIARHDGTIVETPILSNFREGLTALEYFNSTHGARKGLSDTAFKTANSGYLTRRLVDVAQDCVITQKDCGVSEGIVVKALIEGGMVRASLGEQALGRVLAEDVMDTEGACLFPAGTLLDESHIAVLDQHDLDFVRVRSVLTCQAARGVCALCYGRDLAKGYLVNVGEVVGVIAAQSIGEPGTQLTMRTFHTGGAAQRAVEDAFIDAETAGRVVLKNAKTLENRQGENLVINRHTDLMVRDEQGRLTLTYRLPYGALLKVKDGEQIQSKQRLAEWDPYTIPVLAECEGQIKYHDLVSGISLKETVDEMTGIPKRMVSDWHQSSRQGNFHPSLVIAPGDAGDQSSKTQYALSAGMVVLVQDDEKVCVGDVLARLSKDSVRSRDITGGLPRIAELFEARPPKDVAMISEFDGVVELKRDQKVRRRFVVRADYDSKVTQDCTVPKGRRILVQDGDMVKKGDFLVDGTPDLQDILRVLGSEALAAYLIQEIQSVYRLQGVRINDKHIEVIVRQMLKKVEVDDPGDSQLLAGAQLHCSEIEKINGKIRGVGGQEARYHSVIQGITRASLNTTSFLSAAAFQDTTNVLSKAAICRRVDYLEGLKENVVAGRLIPAGTGRVIRQYCQDLGERCAAQNASTDDHGQKESEESVLTG